MSIYISNLDFNNCEQKSSIVVIDSTCVSTFSSKTLKQIAINK